MNSISNFLKDSLSQSHYPIKINGSASPSFIAWLLNEWPDTDKPKIIITPTHKIALQIAQDISAINPSQKWHLLEAFDESPYSGLYPNQACIQNRTRFLWELLKAKKTDVFISSIAALVQKTIPIEAFKSYVFTLSKGDEIDFSTLLKQLAESGYVSAPLVEDGGSYSKRGDILDIFSPALDKPVRVEFFGDQIESLRLFDVETQRSEEVIESAHIVPAREILLTDNSIKYAYKKIKEFCDANEIPKDRRDDFLKPLQQHIYPQGIEYWVPFFYDEPGFILQALREKCLDVWVDQTEIIKAYDRLLEQSTDKYSQLMRTRNLVIPPKELYWNLSKTIESRKEQVHFDHLYLENDSLTSKYNVSVFDISDLSTKVRATREAKKDFFIPIAEKISEWQGEGYRCFIFAGSTTQAQRLHYLFESHGLSPEIEDTQNLQDRNSKKIHIIPRILSQSFRLQEELLVFINEEDLLGEKNHSALKRQKKNYASATNVVSFADLNPGDHIVHVLHGVGLYEGLKKMPVQSVASEFIQLKYRDNDRLYLPIYRIGQIQKYSSPSGQVIIDKLGSQTWQKAKIKVRSSLKEVAGELLQLYAKRASSQGFEFSPPDDDFREFETTFPYDETPDQSKAIDDVLEDMQKARPMDRIVCGDVGFGKTEVAIRAAYKAVLDKKQVAVLVPTTVLAFQHFQTFKKRFLNIPVNIGMLSRFSSSTQIKKDLLAAKEGKIDILIGTHRLLSKDVEFKNLGLLVVDEEHKFGVTHKEKIKRFKTQVDVLTLTATPIPRTLNMGLVGIRDLSLINTPPEDRMSIRTFVSRFDEDTIRKAVLSEVQRGGQVYFIHNRVQSIYGLTDRLRQILPNVRMKVAHGQMPEEELEKTMLEFFSGEFDMLVSTTIIESGLDIPKANTIIMDNAHTFGLSQLYQLRGRVGRSKERAYAYLLIPPTGTLDQEAQERLKIIQKYTDLGSGFHVAHHDLELRGSGNILGEDQSGNIAAVGYELYMELLSQALAEAKGEPLEEEIEPEINIRIPAFIPDKYIEDIRIRLAYYKRLSQILNESDLDKIEEELVDRFGPLPEEAINFFGLMMIRKYCKDLGVRDISTGPKNLNLAFSNSTKVTPKAVIALTTSNTAKYQLTPDQRLISRINSTSWAGILEELKMLKDRLL